MMGLFLTRDDTPYSIRFQTDEYPPVLEGRRILLGLPERWPAPRLTDPGLALSPFWPTSTSQVLLWWTVISALCVSVRLHVCESVAFSCNSSRHAPARVEQKPYLSHSWRFLMLGDKRWSAESAEKCIEEFQRTPEEDSLVIEWWS